MPPVGSLGARRGSPPWDFVSLVKDRHGHPLGPERVSKVCEGTFPGIYHRITLITVGQKSFLTTSFPHSQLARRPPLPVHAEER